MIVIVSTGLAARFVLVPFGFAAAAAAVSDQGGSSHPIPNAIHDWATRCVPGLPTCHMHHTKPLVFHNTATKKKGTFEWAGTQNASRQNTH
jgi:hypothetical protein